MVRCRLLCNRFWEIITYLGSDRDSYSGVLSITSAARVVNGAMDCGGCSYTTRWILNNKFDRNGFGGIQLGMFEKGLMRSSRWYIVHNAADRNNHECICMSFSFAVDNAHVAKAAERSEIPIRTSFTFPFRCTFAFYLDSNGNRSPIFRDAYEYIYSLFFVVSLDLTNKNNNNNNK